MDRLRIVSLNVRGLRKKHKRAALFNFFKQQKFDIVCLQESHINDKVAHIWEKQWGGKMYYFEGTAYSRGEIILVSKYFTGEVNKEKIVDRLMVLSILYQNEKLYITNVYAPNELQAKIEYFEKIIPTLNKYTEEKLIILGDFNSVLNNNLDIISGRPHNVKEVNKFNELLKKLGLIDLWRLKHENAKEYSWSSTNPFIARRIDFCLVNENVINDCVSCEIISTAHSDHRAVCIELTDDTFQKGPGYWRFNNSFLTDPDFLDEMNKNLNNWVKNEDAVDEQEQWELCKLKIKQFCSDFGKEKARKRRNDILDLQIQLKKIEKQCGEEPENETLQDVLLKTKQKLEILEISRAKGAQIRSRAKWIEDGEKNTKYFLTLERIRARSNYITHLTNENGHIVTNQMEVLNEITNYYTKLYSKKIGAEDNIKEHVHNFMKDEHFPSLNEEEAELCEGLVSEHEIGIALQSMKNGSSPGCDGLTVEFYKVFWNQIKYILTKAFNAAFKRDEMSYTQKRGIIVLLHKGKDLPRDRLNNWRPITLTNTDYKILAKTLAIRLSSVIGKLINQDQVGYLKGRNISTVIRTIDDAINYLNVTNKCGYLLALDYQKAFDSISKSFMLETLTTFGLKEQFRKWIELITKNTFSNINHGGWISSPFDLECGIRQGCPFSPLAFILAVELLAIKIRNSRIDGIELPGENECNNNLKIKQLADDTTLFLSNKADIVEGSRIIDDFSKFSGLHLNVGKTKLMKLGKQADQENLPFETTDKIKILGIYFENNNGANIKDNWQGRIETINKLIRTWSKRDLSINGKIVIIKSFLLSQLIYVMQTIGLQDDVLCTINRILYKFVWQRKFSNKKAFEKIKRKIMESSVDKGGVNMVNISKLQESFYLQWAGRLEIADSENWSNIPKWMYGKISKHLGAFEFNCRPNKLKPLTNIPSNFWRKVLEVYLKYKTLTTEEEVKADQYTSQLLWNNRLIRYKNDMLFFPRWQKAGIERVRDIINTYEKRLLNIEEIMRITKQSYATILFECNALFNAIPQKWKNWIGNNPHDQEVQMQPLNIFNRKPMHNLKWIKEQEPNETLKPCAVGFWLRKLNVTVNETVWKTPVNVTKEVRLIELQWKILHNIYPTNIILNKMQIADDNKCSLCRNEVDYLEHFFYKCPPVLAFWEKVSDYIYSTTLFRIRLGMKEILFGIQQSDNMIYNKKTTDTANHLILVGKMCVSIQKKTKSKAAIYTIFEHELLIRNI